VDPSQEARRTIDDLSQSVWAFATLTTALEAGLLDQLAEPQELGSIGGHSVLDPSLAEGILDVLVALGLAHRDGQLFAAAPELAPLLAPQAKEVLLAQLRSTDLQSRQLIDGARNSDLAPGWQHTDPMLLEAQGRSGQGAMPAMVQAIRQNPELAARLDQPSASFLDVGVGVGVIAIELCRAFPALRVVGLEPAPAPWPRRTPTWPQPNWPTASSCASRASKTSRTVRRSTWPTWPRCSFPMRSLRPGWPGCGGRCGPAAG
jgi:hypothetical protein